MRRVPITRIQKKLQRRKERTESKKRVQFVNVKGRKRTDPLRLHVYELENVRSMFRRGFTNEEIIKKLKVSRPTLFRYYSRIGGLTLLDKSEHYKNLQARVDSGVFQDYTL